MDSKDISENRTRCSTSLDVRVGKRKDVKMIQNSGSEQVNEEQVFRETWNVLKCLNMETIFKPKE